MYANTHLVLAHEAEKVVDLLQSDVLLHELAIVVQQVCGGLLGEKIVSDLGLHEAKVLCDVLSTA
jgi:hypothetical protein